MTVVAEDSPAGIQYVGVAGGSKAQLKTTATPATAGEPLVDP